MKKNRLKSHFLPFGIFTLICLIGILAYLILLRAFSTSVEATTANQPKLNYLVLGDSISWLGQGPSGWATLYGNSINTALNTTTTQNNLAVPGWDSGQLLTALNTDSKYQTNIANAHLISLYIGTNDFLKPRFQYLGGTCGGADSQYCFRTYTANFKSNFSQIINFIKANASDQVGLRIVDLYDPTVATDQASGNFAIFNPYFVELNNFIHQTADENGIPVARVYEAFNGTTGTEDPVAKGYLSDGIHQSTLGNSVIAQTLITLGYVPLDPDGDLTAEATDNCPYLSNPAQENQNGTAIILKPAFPFDDATNPITDNIGDACDSDIDHDFLSNTQEQANGTSPTNPDSDNDDIADGVEVVCGSNPLLSSSTIQNPSGISASQLADSDSDGLPDNCETFFGTNPNLRDTDGDGISDGTEVKHWRTDPTKEDTDSDGCVDAVEMASVNGDNKVSSIDLAQIAQRFGATIGTVNYHYTFDQNGDGKISSIDLSLSSQQFGKSCP